MSKKVKKLTPAQRAKRQRERDATLVDYLGRAMAEAKSRHAVSLTPRDLLSVYQNDDLFPIKEIDGRKIPSWKSLSEWVKVHVALWVMDEIRCLAFSIDLNPKHIDRLLSKSPDPDYRALTRDRMRLELSKLANDVPEFFFVIEGADKTGRNREKLHLHGAVFNENPGKDERVKLALKRACGHYIKGSGTTPSAAKVEPVYDLVERWATYSLKNVRREDSRLDTKRVAMSRPLTQAARELWEIITTGV